MQKTKVHAVTKVNKLQLPKLEMEHLHYTSKSQHTVPKINLTLQLADTEESNNKISIGSFNHSLWTLRPNITQPQTFEIVRPATVPANLQLQNRNVFGKLNDERQDQQHAFTLQRSDSLQRIKLKLQDIESWDEKCRPKSSIIKTKSGRHIRRSTQHQELRVPNLPTDRMNNVVSIMRRNAVSSAPAISAITDRYDLGKPKTSNFKTDQTYHISNRSQHLLSSKQSTTIPTSIHQSRKLRGTLLRFAQQNSSHSDHYRKLLQAISLGDSNLVGDVIEVCSFVCGKNSGHIVNQVDRVGTLPIIAAAQHGLTDVCEVLIRYGAKVVGVQDTYGWTPGLAALYGGHAETIELLSKHNDCVTVNDVISMEVIWKRHLGYKKRKLIKVVTELWQKRLIKSCMQQNLKNVHYIFQYNPWRTNSQVINATDERSGDTALHIAAKMNHLDIFQTVYQSTLIRRDTPWIAALQMTKKNKLDLTPMGTAALFQSIDILRFGVRHKIRITDEELATVKNLMTNNVATNNRCYYVYGQPKVKRTFSYPIKVLLRKISNYKFDR